MIIYIGIHAWVKLRLSSHQACVNLTSSSHQAHFRSLTSVNWFNWCRPSVWIFLQISLFSISQELQNVRNSSILKTYHYTTKEIQRPNLFWTCLVMLWDGKRGKSGVLWKILHKFTSIFSFHVETMMLFCFYTIKIQNELLLN